MKKGLKSLTVPQKLSMWWSVLGLQVPKLNVWQKTELYDQRPPRSWSLTFQGGLLQLSSLPVSFYCHFLQFSMHGHTFTIYSLLLLFFLPMADACFNCCCCASYSLQLMRPKSNLSFIMSLSICIASFGSTFFTLCLVFWLCHFNALMGKYLLVTSCSYKSSAEYRYGTHLSFGTSESRLSASNRLKRGFLMRQLIKGNPIPWQL